MAVRIYWGYSRSLHPKALQGPAPARCPGKDQMPRARDMGITTCPQDSSVSALPLSGCSPNPTVLILSASKAAGTDKFLGLSFQGFLFLPWHQGHNFYHSASAGILIKTSGALSLWLSCFSKVEDTLRGKQRLFMTFSEPYNTCANKQIKPPQFLRECPQTKWV